MRHNLNRDGATYRITSTTNVGGTRKPRTTTLALSDCVCYDADMNVIKVIARSTAPNRTARKSNRTPIVTRTVAPTRYDASHDRDLLSKMGSIHQ